MLRPARRYRVVLGLAMLCLAPIFTGCTSTQTQSSPDRVEGVSPERAADTSAGRVTESPSEIDSSLDGVTEIRLYAPGRNENVTVKADSDTGRRLMRSFSEAARTSAPQGETTPEFSIVFKRSDAVIATVHFSGGDQVLRAETGGRVIGLVSPELAGSAETLVRGRD